MTDNKRTAGDATQNKVIGEGPVLLVLAAGMGSRYGGLKQTDSFGPNGETLLEYTVFDALQAGFTRVVFVVREEFAEEFEQRIAARFRPFTDVRLALQRLEALPDGVALPAGRVKPLGTVQAVLAAAPHLDRPFALVNADDLYGRDALCSLATGLQELPTDGTAAVLISYPLGSTLSDFGAVTRGVCTVGRAGELLNIEEVGGLRPSGAGACSTDGRAFTIDTPVAVNLMGFAPVTLAVFRRLFAEFCATEDLTTAELPVSTALGTLLAEDALQVRVRASGGVWCGVTVREDKPIVEAHVAAQIVNGVYPARLWSTFS